MRLITVEFCKSRRFLIGLFLSVILSFLVINQYFSEKTTKSNAQITCKDVDYRNINYQIYERNMNQLASFAKLPDGYWNKYHADVIGNLCAGTHDAIVAINESIDNGYVLSSEVESIAIALGKVYTAPVRTTDGKLYEATNKKLLGLGLCIACASTIASEYVNNRDVQLTKIVNAALTGDKNALDRLSKFGQDSEPERSNLATTTNKAISTKESIKLYNNCLLHNIKRGYSEIETTRICIESGIVWCVNLGLPTDTNYTVSSLSGRVIINNNDCANTLNQQYKIVRESYDIEFDNCIRAENAGIPCKPIVFDIRAIP